MIKTFFSMPGLYPEQQLWIFFSISFSTFRTFEDLGPWKSLKTFRNRKMTSISRRTRLTWNCLDYYRTISFFTADYFVSCHSLLCDWDGNWQWTVIEVSLWDWKRFSCRGMKPKIVQLLRGVKGNTKSLLTLKLLCAYGRVQDKIKKHIIMKNALPPATKWQI